jgi:hypothetical protein
LATNTIGNTNTAIGIDAGRYAGSGSSSNTNSNTSVYIGTSSRPSASGNANEIVIGNGAIGNGSNTATIGDTSTTATYLKGNVSTTGSVKVGTDVTAASATNVGAIRYRTSGNNSYCEMSMQTGSSLYAWVVIKTNTW